MISSWKYKFSMKNQFQKNYNNNIISTEIPLKAISSPGVRIPWLHQMVMLPKRSSLSVIFQRIHSFPCSSNKQLADNSFFGSMVHTTGFTLVQRYTYRVLQTIHMNLYLYVAGQSEPFGQC